MPLIAAIPLPYFGIGATNPNPALVSSLSAAIRQQEGFYPGSAAYRNNNPGNLMDPGHKIWPQYQTDSAGRVVFPDLGTGQAALENDLSIKINRGMSITSLLSMYAPAAAGNDTATYIANVSSRTGIDPNVPLNELPQGGIPEPDLSASSDGFDLTNLFGTDSDSPAGSTQAGALSGLGMSPEALAGLVVAGIALFLYFRD